MAFIDPREGINDLVTNVPPEVTGTTQVNSVNNVQDIIDASRAGVYERQMLRWRVPLFGWITMFLNPENITTADTKEISRTRTKAGFIFQYAGENLTEITLRGTTGSSGMEGINILRSIYRSEQLAFERIADEIDRTGPLAEFLQLSRGATGTDFFNAPLLGAVTERTADIALNILSQPFPTLSSLAANVELFFQGELYRGYFNGFTVEEDAQSPGLFTYTLNYVAYARQGVRRNFMPWHRQPFNPIGAATGKPNPLSFAAAQDTNTNITLDVTEEAVELVERAADQTFRNRSTNTASGTGGSGLEERDLRL